MFKEVSGQGADQLYYCDVCSNCEIDSGSHTPEYMAIYEIPDFVAGVDCSMHLCGSCLRDYYKVDDIVLAFYPELAEVLNQDPDLAATARSVELPFDELQSVVVIREYEDYSKIPEQDILPQKGEGSGLTKPRVKVVTIQGRIDERKPESIIFEIHAGFAPLTESPPSMSRMRPRVHMKGAKWIALENYARTAGVRAVFEYNLYDVAGFEFLCEWAKAQAKEWLCKWHLDMIKKAGLIDLTRI